MALIRGEGGELFYIKGNVKNLQVSDSEPMWPSCLAYLSQRFMVLLLSLDIRRASSTIASNDIS